MKTLNRRAVLRGIGGIGISLPMLDIMGEKAHAADPGGVAKRLLYFVLPSGFGGRYGADASKGIYGTDPFWPIGGETGFTMPLIHKGLEPYQKDLLFLRYLGRPLGTGQNNHDSNISNIMFGTRCRGSNDSHPLTGMSIDQYIAGGVPATKFKSLQLRVPMSLPNIWPISYSSPDTPNQPVFNPQRVFNTLFKDFSATPLDPNDPQVLAAKKLTLRKKSIIDFVAADFGRLNAKLGRDDKQKLDAHLGSVREIEKKLQQVNYSGASASCTKPALDFGADSKPIPADGVSWKDSDKYWVDAKDAPTMELAADLFVRLAAEALACDMTRVITLQFAAIQGGGPYSFLGVRYDEHALNHGVGNNPQVGDPYGGVKMQEKIFTWYSKKFAALVDALGKKQDGAGTVLSNSAVVWQQEFGAGSHWQDSMPTIIAGQCGGYFRTGRYLEYPKSVSPGGEGTGADGPNKRFLNDLHLTLIDAMGLPPPPGGKFGEPGWCKGILPNMG